MADDLPALTDVVKVGRDDAVVVIRADGSAQAFVPAREKIGEPSLAALGLVWLWETEPEERTKVATRARRRVVRMIAQNERESAR